MLRSLVGSEMCIRDSPWYAPLQHAASLPIRCVPRLFLLADHQSGPPRPRRSGAPLCVRLSSRCHWPPSSPVLPLFRRLWTTGSAIFPLYRLLRPAGMCYQVPTLPLVVVFSPFATVRCLPHQAAPGDRLHRGSSDRDPLSLLVSLLKPVLPAVLCAQCIRSVITTDRASRPVMTARARCLVL